MHLLAADVSFELAEEVIDAEAPPRSFDEYTRENLDDVNSNSSNNNGNGYDGIEYENC